MAFFNEEFMNLRREYFLNSMEKFQYKISNTWYDGVIKKKEVEGNNVVVDVHFPVDPVDIDNGTISGVRVMSVEGIVAGEQTVDIEISRIKGILMRFRFPILEVD